MMTMFGADSDDKVDILTTSQLSVKWSQEVSSSCYCGGDIGQTEVQMGYLLFNQSSQQWRGKYPLEEVRSLFSRYIFFTLILISLKFNPMGPGLGQGLPKQFPSLRFFLIFHHCQNTDYILNNTLIFDSCLQLSGGDTCQIWMWFKEPDMYFWKIKNFLNREINGQGPDSIQRCRLTSTGNLIVEIRRSHDRLISTMGVPILVRRHLYIESGPRALCKPHPRSQMKPLPEPKMTTITDAIWHLKTIIWVKWYHSNINYMAPADMIKMGVVQVE